MTILCLKLASGQELIAECEQMEIGYIAKEAIEIFQIPNEDGKTQSFGFAPFCPYTKGEFIIPFAMAITSFPSEELETAHKERFSKIILPPSSIIV